MASLVLIVGNLIADLLLAMRIRGSAMTEIVPPDATVAARGAEVPPRSSEDVVAPQSPAVVFWTQMRKSPLAIAGGVVLALFYLLALFAPFVAPYPQEEMDRAKYFHPPQTLHWVRADGRFSLRPYVRDMRVTDMSSFTYEEDAARELPVKFFVRGYSYELMGFLPSSLHLYGVDPPGRIFLFGSDSFGREVLSRLLFGAQISLTVGLWASRSRSRCGLMLGGIAGYFGGFSTPRSCG
jgi:peptide/nickel transport system permease protein